jgi:hypothetical protein
MNYQTLISDEKARLVMIILEAINEPIEFDEFQETIGLMIENIPGLEFLCDDSFSTLVNDCWEIYSTKPVAHYSE